MSEARRKAQEAQRLLDDATFQAVITEIRDGAVAAFLSTAATAETLARAHEQVRAVETFLNALETRKTDWAIEEKQESLDRGSDRR